MRTSRAVALATLAGAVAFGAVVLVGSAAEPGKGVARFRETPVTHAVQGAFAGATEVWHTQVWLPHKAQTVGSGLIACIRADDNTTIRECSGTYILPRGRIQVAGEIINRAAFQLAIIGGSGIYGGTGGILVVQPGGLVTFFLS